MLKNHFWLILFCLLIQFSDVMPSQADTTVGGIVSSDTTWTLAGSPYNVTSTVQVYGTSTTPVTLTIQPGVVMKFASNAGLQIGNGTSQGALIAQGTTSDRITFTRSATSGTWGSVNFQPGTVSATTDLENVDIQYNTGVTITSASPTIRNSTITNVTGYGLNLSSASPIIDTVTITNTGSYGLYLVSSSPTITNSTITCASISGIYLSSSSPTITGGSLTNTSTTGSGIYGSGSPIISNYNVSIANSVGIYGLYLSSPTSALSVTNSTISNGLYIGSTGITPTVSGSTFTNLDNAPIHAGANIIASILASNTFNGLTSAGRIEIVGEQVKQDTLWSKLIAPYWVVSGNVSVYKDATTAATLTIDPGTVIKFAGGAGLQIGNGTSKGALIARGTTTDRITFTHSVASGNWGTITFNDGTVDATTIIENTDIQYSTGIVMTSASPTIKNSTLTNVIGYGLNLTTSSPVIDTVTITNDGNYGIYLYSSSPTITGGSLTNTNARGYGFYGSGSPIISNYNVSIANVAGNYGLYLNTFTSAFSVTNSTIGNGLYLSTTGITPIISGNTFTNLDNSPIHAGANIIASIVSANILTGLTSAGRIEVVGEQVKQDTTWSKLVAPYWILGTVSVYKDTSTAATLTIDPGVVIKFAGGSGLQIGNDTSKGALVARGTTTDRITFTRSATSGNWGNITFTDGTVDATTIIENVDIQYSSWIAMTSASPTIKNSTLTNVIGHGFYLSTSNPILENVTISNNGVYGIYLNSSSPIISGGSLTNSSASGSGINGSGSPIISNYNVSIVNIAGNYGLNLSSSTSAFSVTNSSIANGLYIGSTGITPTISGNTFSNCDNSPLHAGANIIVSILANNTFNGLTSAGRIEIVGEQVKQNTLWSKLVAPYWVVSGTVSVFKDSTTAATLTIDPGTVVKFAVATGLQVGNGTSKGALIARGTTTDRITFTRSAASGNWGSVTFNDGTVDATTIIENADIQYSTGIVMTSASPTIRNSTLTNVSGYGLNLTTSNPVIDTVTINCAGYLGISLLSSSPIITGGSLVSTSVSGYGINGTGSPVISNYNVSIANNVGIYGLYLSSTTSDFSVTNSTISNGLYIGSTAIVPTVTGNTFSNSDNSPLHAGANIIVSILANNTFNGLTSAGRIEIVGEQVNQDTTWNKLVAPYWVVSGNVSVFKDATTAATLTIVPGTTVKFASGSGLQIGNGTSKGALIARGTTDRITFTRSAASNTWAGITFNDGTVDATTIIENADIQYSSGIVMTSASPTIKNSTLTNVSGYGLNLTTSNPIIDTVTITTNNSTYGIYLSTSSPIISGGSLTNTFSGGHGIYGSGSPVISNYNVSIVNVAGKYGLYLSSSLSALSVTNSTIANGLYLGTTTALLTISGNTFSNSDTSPPHAGANNIASILAGNTFNDQTSAGRIEVVGEQVNQNATWPKLVVPYWVSGTVSVYKDVSTAATLTINSGVVIKFATGSVLQIGNGTSQGALIARGTTTDRITLTRSAASGNWGNITFNDGTVDATTIIENADIQYSTGVIMNSASPTIRNSAITNVTGGNYGFMLTNSNPIIDTVTITYTGYYGFSLSSSSPIITGGSLTTTTASGYSIYGSGSPVISNYNVSMANGAGNYGLYLVTSSTSALSVTNSTITNGLYLGVTGITPTITGNTFTNSDTSPPHAGANNIGQIMSANTFTGMTGAGRIEVIGELVNQDVTWKKQIAPYVMLSGTVTVYKDTVTAATLTIESGTIVKFASGTGLQIGSSPYRGTLIAIGSTAAINFTSNQATPAPGNWTGIALSGDAASSSVMDNVTIEYGGAGGAYSNANLSLTSSSPMIRNSVIRNSAGSGIYLTGAANSPLVQSCTIYGNKWGVYVTSSNPSIVNSSIYGNSTAGAWNSSTSTIVDARDNWWGAPSGPNNASNPTGTGNVVSNAALFNPWLNQAPASGFSFMSAKVTPLSFNANGGNLIFSATLSAAANWTITITDSQSNVIRTFTGSGSTINQLWVGDNSLAAKVADGSYNYQIQAVNTATQVSASPLVGSVTVVSQLPIAILAVPTNNQVYTGGSVISVTGTASDPVALASYTLDYGAGDNPSSWTVLKSGTSPVQNALIASWDLSTATGGVYTLRLTATNRAGYSTASTARIMLLWVQNASVSEGFFSPNGDGIKDTTVINATASYPVNWTVTVSNGTGTVVRTLTGTGISCNQTWDGKDSNGVVVPDGTYNYQVNAIDPVSSIQALPKTGTTVVDTTPPTASITTPVSGSAVLNTVAIVGTAADTNFNSYKVEYGPASGAGPWTQVTTSTSPITASTLASWVTNDLTNAVLMQNGSYLLRLTVTDKAGNVSTATLPVTVDNMILSSVSASQHTLNTNAGESSNVSFTINRPGTVTLSIVPDKLGPNGAPVYQNSINFPAAGPYSIAWNGTDSTGKAVPDEAYLYILNASDGTRTDGYSPPAPIGTGSVTCTQGNYYPRKNVPLTISYSVAQPERVNINISWGSKNFKVVDGVPQLSGSYTFNWDGRDPSNKMLNGGAGASCSAPSLLAENDIISTGNTPKITYVTTDPYQVQLSYGQITKVKYAVSKQAYVTVKILPPTANGITLVDNVLQAGGDYDVNWDASVSTGSGFIVSEEGDYTVWVQVKDPVTGVLSVTRGNLYVGD